MASFALLLSVLMKSDQWSESFRHCQTDKSDVCFFEVSRASFLSQLLSDVSLFDFPCSVTVVVNNDNDGLID